MLGVIALDTMKKEEVNLSEILKTAYSKRELPIKRLAVFSGFEALSEHYAENADRYNVFIALISEGDDDYIKFARRLRREKDDVFIVFAVDRNADISSCVRPSIRPSGILFIPPDKEHLYRVINEIYAEHLRSTEKEKQPMFKIKSGGDYFTVDTGDIFFFESQGKKIALKTAGQEISFYSNFDSVLEQLPDWFIRCHKGFVINITKVLQANFTEMTLTLRDKSVIPISRTYRDNVRMLIESGDNYARV